MFLQRILAVEKQKASRLDLDWRINNPCVPHCHCNKASLC